MNTSTAAFIPVASVIFSIVSPKPFDGDLVLAFAIVNKLSYNR